MGAKDDLWEWFCSLNAVEQYAIRYWVESGDRSLILELAKSSGNLFKFVEVVFADGSS